MQHLYHTLLIANFLGDFFRPLIDALQWLLETFESWASQFALARRIGTWGIAIIMLTMLVRTLMLPLTIKQYRSAAAMAALQPKIKALQKKYKKDRAKLQEETMKLYREYRVNPFASCLPILLQMPIFICLYYAIKGEEALQLGRFLWIPAGEVTSLDPYKYIHGLGNPDPTYILFVLYIVSQMISTELMMAPETEKQQKMIMRAMPIFFAVILYRFPSGLFVYWVTTNLWTIGQQVLIRRRMHKPDPDSPPPPKKESRFMKALTDAQARQKERGQDAKQRVAKLRGEEVDDDEAADDDESGVEGEAPAEPAEAGAAGAKAKARPKGQGGRPRGGGQGQRKSGGKRPSKPGGQGGSKPGGQGGSKPGGKRPSKPSGAGDGR